MEAYVWAEYSENIGGEDKASWMASLIHLLVWQGAQTHSMWVAEFGRGEA